MLNGYFWLKFIHVGAVFAFLLPHGASGAASLLLEHRRDLAMRRFLLELSWKAQSISTPALLVVLLSGLGLGFWGGWWRYDWIWTALVIFLAVSAGMIYFSYRFDIARKAAGLDYRAGTKVLPAVPPDEELLAKQIRRLRSRELAVAGVFWLAVILLLMMFKPF
jgi:hypothetical protein